MLDLLIGSLSEIKSYVVVLSFFIKIMKQRTFQACSLKHSTKMGMFYVQSKLNFFKSGRGIVLPSPPPPGYAHAESPIRDVLMGAEYVSDVYIYILINCNCSCSFFKLINLYLYRYSYRHSIFVSRKSQR